MRKLTGAIKQADMSGITHINQIRMKIGLMFGNQETAPPEVTTT